jgi:hypothetical protein
VAKIGVMTAPVAASGFCRPWMARVEKPAAGALSLSGMISPLAA